MTVNLAAVRQIGVTCTDAPCESVEAAMRAGRFAIDILKTTQQNGDKLAI